MPTFILASYIACYEKGENGIRYPIHIPNTNKVLDNICNNLKGCTTLVFVANEPDNFDEHEEKAKCIFESFIMSGVPFENYVVLNNKNKEMAKEIIASADLVYLSGGQIVSQINFFNEIGLGELLENFGGVVVGVSAGAMNLCNKVFNFPEEPRFINDPRIVDGLGFYNQYIIPHFDCCNVSYEVPCTEIDPINDYILPFSEQTTLLGLDNDSYIILHDGKAEFVGRYCTIKNRQAVVYNNNEKSVEM